MNTILRKLTVVLAVIALGTCALAGCASVDETGAKNVYKCSKDNIFVLKKVVLYEDKAVVVFDKYAGDVAQFGIDYTDDFTATVKADGEWCDVTDKVMQDTLTEYIVTVAFEPADTVEIITVQGRYITINGGDFELSYLEWGGECSMEFTQSFDGEWSEMKCNTTLYPLECKEDIEVDDVIFRNKDEAPSLFIAIENDPIFCDVTGDGAEDKCFCAYWGSGMPRVEVVVYDELSDRKYILDGYDYSYYDLAVEDGNLIATQVGPYGYGDPLTYTSGTVVLETDKLVFVPDGE